MCVLMFMLMLFLGRNRRYAVSMTPSFFLQPQGNDSKGAANPTEVPVPRLPCTFIDVPAEGRCFFGAVLASGHVHDPYSTAFLTAYDAAYFKRTCFHRLHGMLSQVRFLWTHATAREEASVKQRHGSSVEEWLKTAFLEVGRGETTAVVWAGRLQALVTVLVTRLRIITLSCYELPNGGSMWKGVDWVNELLATGIAKTCPTLYHLRRGKVVLVLHHRCGSPAKASRVAAANHFGYLRVSEECDVKLHDAVILERLQPVIEAVVDDGKGVDMSSALTVDLDF
eukprot:GHVU01025362.1.p1 GENE.GHVU01025362.1~~GHVU01025362.1.p1  ORF type:complete len:282 (+),score=24.57 GHVU01025362.1:910-1755(+)